ncbi:PucR family transcriptional regulator [Luteipulveratus mongoliensis]|uniref:PucR family transcriptional regulator n=1 Tax=Luteipulveratus mongoliensis TaxID=571913 RepID=A0A0K1JIT1_9MICO|nr:helix-turn-helix domain-containing protein [Luteipulveratus mongoliensis]AKU16611.1 PucR family transcriptional regulator [Luteipulveratus mongoliensis]
MSGPTEFGSAATRQRLERHAGTLSTAAAQRMEATHDWYRALSAEDRSWVGLVAQAGIGAFISWVRDPTTTPAGTIDVFGSAPRELTRSISLRQTLDLVRTVIDVVESHVDEIAAPGEEAELQAAVLHYSREIAFAAAQVYAQAAEERGAWDARLESLVVDAILRGEADDSLQSRVAALGWGTVSNIVVVAGEAPSGSEAGVVDALRSEADRRGVEGLAAVQGHRLMAVLGSIEDPLGVVSQMQARWGPGPIVVGPVVPHVYAAGRSARAALSGLAAARAWPDAPRPCLSDELLGERALNGDSRAHSALVDRIQRPLAGTGASLLETATAFLDTGGLEATARLLFVHPNTVRYRLRRIAELTGYDLTVTHDAFTVRIGLALALLDEPRRWRRPSEDHESDDAPVGRPTG